jgi:hypothetical protein
MGVVALNLSNMRLNLFFVYFAARGQRDITATIGRGYEEASVDEGGSY